MQRDQRAQMVFSAQSGTSSIHLHWLLLPVRVRWSLRCSHLDSARQGMGVRVSESGTRVTESERGISGQGSGVRVW